MINYRVYWRFVKVQLIGLKLMVLLNNHRHQSRAWLVQCSCTLLVINKEQQMHNTINIPRCSGTRERENAVTVIRREEECGN